MRTIHIHSLAHDWSEVERFLAPRGSRRGELTIDQEAAARLRADGCGLLRLEACTAAGEIRADEKAAKLWSWEHISKSSASAIREMAAYLRQIS